MNDRREVTEADLDRTLAAAFGRKPRPDPAKSTMTLEEAQDVSMGAVFNRPNLTPALVSEAKSVIAYHAQRVVEEVAAVEAGGGMSAAQEAQLEAARLRAAAAAASQGRTAAEATAYSQALLRHIQTEAVAEGRSFGQVIDLIDRVSESLRKTSRDGARPATEASKGRPTTIREAGTARRI